MSNQDEINPRRARQYAWRYALTEPLDEEPDSAEPEPDSGTDTDTDRSLELAELAAQIEQTWAISDPAAQQHATVALLRSAAESEETLITLSVFSSLAAMRLLRLAQRHYRALGAEADELMPQLCLFASFDHPEAAELLLDIARAGDRRFVRWLELPLTASFQTSGPGASLQQTQLCIRLCALLDEEFSWASRELALDWLFLDCTKEAIPTLRRALRLPHLGIRRRALTLLVRAFTPPALEASELLFLLDDLFVHPPVFQSRPQPFWAQERSQGYADALTEALRQLHPSEAVAPLLRILNFDHHTKGLKRSGCDDQWALKALAAAYPSEALPYIDRYLRKPWSWSRRTAVDAAALLPAEEARPRLLRAASDGAPHVAAWARSRFEDCFGVACPVQPLDGIATELLSKPPSEKFFTRLAVLRTPSEEARQTMLEVLLGEAPDPEALVLILFALADDTLLHKRLRPKLPKDRKALTARLYRRFGLPAVHALCLLADKYPGPDGNGGLFELRELAETVRLAKPDVVPLRELALRRLQIETFAARQGAFMLLTEIGAPAELYPQLFDWVLTGADAWIFAADVLAKVPKDRARLAALADHLEAAFQAGDGARLTRLSCTIPKRPLALLLSTMERLVSQWIALPVPAANASDAERKRYASPEMQSGILALAQRLRAVGKLSPEWIKDSLDTPASRAFLLAVNLVEAAELDDATLAPMLRALDSDAHGGAAALEAAVNLLRHGKGVSAEDPRLLRLAQTAHGDWRGRIMFMLLYAGAPMESLRSAIVESLCSDDREEAESMGDTIERFVKPFGVEALAELLPQVRMPQVAALLTAALAEQQDPRAYWQESAIRLPEED